MYECINKINEKIYIAPINATVKVENGELAFTNEQEGLAIDKQKLKNDIISKIENIYDDKIKINTQKIRPKYTKKE
ncbi:MAG: peptidoglycan binding domain-containing protein [Romboutsia sp.]|nr:peptidoglycan binding domain-containing protein [Romboutsia sp.]